MAMQRNMSWRISAIHLNGLAVKLMTAQSFECSLCCYCSESAESYMRFHWCRTYHTQFCKLLAYAATSAKILHSFSWHMHTNMAIPMLFCRPEGEAALFHTVACSAAVLFRQRLRTPSDRQHVQELFAVTMHSPWSGGCCNVAISPGALMVGQAVVARLAPSVAGDHCHGQPGFRSLGAF